MSDDNSTLVVARSAELLTRLFSSRIAQGYVPLAIASLLLGAAVGAGRCWYAERKEYIDDGTIGPRDAFYMTMEPPSKPQRFAALTHAVRTISFDEHGGMADTHQLAIDLISVPLPTTGFEPSKLKTSPDYIFDHEVYSARSESALRWLGAFQAQLPREHKFLVDLSSANPYNVAGPVRVLFLSVDGHVMSWSKSGASVAASDDLAKQGYDPRGKYIFSALRQDLRRSTQAEKGRCFEGRDGGKPVYEGAGFYVDQEGGGLLELCCIGLMASEGSRDPTLLAAAVCIEYAKGILPTHHKKPPFDSCLVEKTTVPGGQRADWKAEKCTFFPSSASDLQESVPLPLKDGAIGRSSAAPSASPLNALNPMNPVGVDGVTSMQFGTRTGERGREGIAVMVRRTGQGELWVLMTASEGHFPTEQVVVGLVALLAVLLAAIAKRRTVMRQASTSLVRNLQVGVVRVDAQMNILEANDRAEELVGYDLPTIGAGEQPKELSRYFDNEGWEAPERSQDGSVRELERITLKDVIARRARGESSRYFLRKKFPKVGLPERAWLELYGSPVLSADTHASEGIFAVIDIPSEQRQKQLEDSIIYRKKWRGEH